MASVTSISSIVSNFEFRRGDCEGAANQLVKFADAYSTLSPQKAELLRSLFDPKERLGWLQVATSLFKSTIQGADTTEKEELCKIFFALYSFDNLSFGYDSILHLISVFDEMKSDMDIVQKSWMKFSELTPNELARRNVENRL